MEIDRCLDFLYRDKRFKKEFDYVKSEMELLSNGDYRVMGGRTYTDKEFMDRMLQYLVEETVLATERG